MNEPFSIWMFLIQFCCIAVMPRWLPNHFVIINSRSIITHINKYVTGTCVIKWILIKQNGISKTAGNLKGSNLSSCQICNLECILTCNVARPKYMCCWITRSKIFLNYTAFHLLSILEKTAIVAERCQEAIT